MMVNIIFDLTNSYFLNRINDPRQTFKNLSGLTFCFLRVKFRLSVGAFCERHSAAAFLILFIPRMFVFQNFVKCQIAVMS